MASPAQAPIRDRRRAAFAAVGAVLVFIADQASKAVVRSSLPLHEPLDVIPGFFHLRYALNDGAAWSILSGARWFLVAISSAVLALLLAKRRELLNETGRLGPWVFALLCGGVAGTLLDRLLPGHVVDFLDFVFGTYHFPTFNVADSAICVGMALYLIAFLFPRPKTR